MKNLKKVLAFALAFVMVLGVVLPAVHAAEGARDQTKRLYAEDEGGSSAGRPESQKGVISGSISDSFNVSVRNPIQDFKDVYGHSKDFVRAKGLDGKKDVLVEATKEEWNKHKNRVKDWTKDVARRFGFDKGDNEKVIKLTFKFNGVEKDNVVKEVKVNKYDYSNDPIFKIKGYKLANPEALKGDTPVVDTLIDLKYVKEENSSTDIEEPSTEYVTSGDGQKIAIDEIAKVEKNATALPLIIGNNSSVPVTVEVHNSKHQIQGEPYVIPAGGKVVTEPFAIGTKLYVVPTNPDAEIWKDVATKTVTIKAPEKMEVYRKDANGKFEVYGYKFINTNNVAFEYVRLDPNEENPVKDVKKMTKVKDGTPVKVAKGKASGNNPSTGDPSMIGYVVTTVVAAAAAFATKKNYK